MRAAPLAAAAALALAAGCGGREEAPPPAAAPTRTVVFGIDGADWDRALPLLRQGRMPALARLVRSGARRTLLTVPPDDRGNERLSPTIWTSAATGVLPERHGILHFVTQRPGGGQLPVTSNQRRTAALWNMASARGLTVGVIGWLVTWPAEPVNGWLVSSYTPFIFRWNADPAGRPIKGTLVAGVPNQVWPPELQAGLESLKVAPDGVDAAAVVPRFLGVDAPGEPGEDAAKSLEGLRWSWAADETYRRAWRRLAEDPPGGRRPDLELLYFASVDVVSHRFWKYGEPASHLGERPGDDEVRAYGRAVESAYAHVDAVLADVLGAEGDAARLFVLSDHGFRANPNADARSSGWHRPQGLLVAEGPGIRRGARLPGGSVLDVAPTVLYSLDLPVGEDLDGDPALDLFTREHVAAHPVRTIGSWEPEVAREREGAPVASPVDAEILERLEALGYLD